MNNIAKSSFAWWCDKHNIQVENKNSIKYNIKKQYIEFIKKEMQECLNELNNSELTSIERHEKNINIIRLGYAVAWLDDININNWITLLNNH